MTFYTSRILVEIKLALCRDYSTVVYVCRDYFTVVYVYRDY